MDRSNNLFQLFLRLLHSRQSKHVQSDRTRDDSHLMAAHLRRLGSRWTQLYPERGPLPPGHLLCFLRAPISLLSQEHASARRDSDSRSLDPLRNVSVDGPLLLIPGGPAVCQKEIRAHSASQNQPRYDACLQAIFMNGVFVSA